MKHLFFIISFLFSVTLYSQSTVNIGTDISTITIGANDGIDVNPSTTIYGDTINVSSSKLLLSSNALNYNTIDGTYNINGGSSFVVSNLTGNISFSSTGSILLNNNSSFVSLTGGNVNVKGPLKSDFLTTTGWYIPQGTTAQRPSSVSGLVRYNTTLNKYDFVENGNYVNYATTNKVNTFTEQQTFSIAPNIGYVSLSTGQNLTSSTPAFVGVNSSSASLQIGLLNSLAASNIGKVFIITKSDNSAHTVDITVQGTTIKTLTLHNEVVRMFSNGTTWLIW